MSIEKSIQNKLEERKNNIMKGIVEYGSNISPRQAIEENDLEKARNVGETKVGKDGITRVWTKLPNGKFDWRRQGSNTKTSTPKSDSDDSKKEVEKDKLGVGVNIFWNDSKGNQKAGKITTVDKDGYYVSTGSRKEFIGFDVVTKYMDNNGNFIDI